MIVAGSGRRTAMVLFGVALVGLLGPWIAPHDPAHQDLVGALSGPSFANWLGTDHLGRDTLSRILHAARPAMIGSSLALVIAVVVGVPIGVTVGYRRGLLDRLVMTAVDGLTALPGMIVVIAILAISGPGMLTSMVAIGVVLSFGFVRLARTVTMSISGEAYVDAARLLGRSRPRIMFDHVLPNVAAPLIVHASTVLATALIAEASLAFLGLGAQPPNPSWGVMLAEASAYTVLQPFLAIPPGVAIVVAVLACQVAGAGLRGERNQRAANTSLRQVLPTLIPEAVIGSGTRDGEQSLCDSGDPESSVAWVRGLTISVRDAPSLPPLVRALDLTVAAGEIVGVAGSSGSGKTITGLSLAGLLTPTLTATATAWSGRALTAPAGRGATMVLQDPYASLSPVRTVGSQLMEVARLRLGCNNNSAARATLEGLAAVGLGHDVLARHAHELSGGMAQRVAIALALIGRPSLVVADEPTTALDVHVQAEILRLFTEARNRFGTAFVVISHDLGVLAAICDRVMVMADGRVVDHAPTSRLLTEPAHERTMELVAARRDLELPSADRPRVQTVAAEGQT